MLFSQLPSFARLCQLAKKAPLLNKAGFLTQQRIATFAASAEGFTLSYATERVSEEILQALFDLAAEAQAVDQMEAMQQGAVLNQIKGYPSEQRSVLHTAMRDLFSHKQTAPPAALAAKLSFAEIEKLRLFMQQIGGRFTDLIQVGIGGSELGPQAMVLALQAYAKPGRRVHFVSNVDPDDAAAVLNHVDLSKTLIVVISKSGTTLETATNEALVRQRLETAGLKPQEHLIAVTGKGSPMDNPNRYRASFYIWDYVGGRYSATSMVGAVAIGFVCGMETFLEFLKGASAMDKCALHRDPRLNLPLLAALLGIWNRNFLSLPTLAVIPYSQALCRFPAHLQQLEMESNGKQIDKEGNFVDFSTGPVVWGEPGTNGQHSFFQLLHQGTEVVPLELIGFHYSQYGQDLSYAGSFSQQKLLANLVAQAIALATGEPSGNPNKRFLGNRPSRILYAQRLDACTLGSLLAYYEHKVAFQGFIWGINSFDQEGVQLGKVLALKVLDQMGSQEKLPMAPLELAAQAYLQLFTRRGASA